ncbi:hypothetical protein BDU57DRAFT_489411 [Ampelomyces quisqualis]|uniref:Uncharacterized protein n=1 Tax=Ampelomyces quisqualis TaxID=50730 RepID=A0A6A5R314_AMPQU|nr:hypothetical protein BDU57DRAFT_489411 [Ampelomyces quisqualis]
MAQRHDYAMTHEAPNNTELALLSAFIDQRVTANLLRHKNRMFALLSANGLIARSNIEQRFIARVLSMYAQTKAASGLVGTNGHLDSGSLEIRDGKLDGKPYVGIVSVASKDVVLRGPTRDTETGAMESFIDTVLLTSKQWQVKIESQRDEYNDLVARDST